ncbi:adenosylhomocysteine nucleosidase [Paenibacillus dendritiformis C454]|uniref:adenosylhomocysteine nucleosidase n=2 Tax=Paenibacillus dendritiformis TaxID=130049 RepID=H3SMX3_9BACL|nr:adenosylhomocysteine nucleosidase [Paenibacillus dendritiformis C454]
MGLFVCRVCCDNKTFDHEGLKGEGDMASEAVIGIIGAMDEEIERLLQAAQEVEEVKVTGMTFYRGNLAGQPVVICKSGVGKVNAAVTTQVLIDRFGAKQVLFTGVAGAIHPELNIGDIVISTYCMHHDMDVTALGFEPGVIPFQETSRFEADGALIQLAEQVCAELFPGRYLKGGVLSGDQFIASRDKVKALFETFPGSACTEMEGAAVAQVCHIHAIPFVIIRSMSDKADGSAHVNFAEFTVEAALHSYQIIERMVSQSA